MRDVDFERFLHPGTMVDAELALLALGTDALPVLTALFSGAARNAFGVPYRQLGLPLQCAIKVAERLGPQAKSLECFLRDEAEAGNPDAAMALGALATLAPDTVAVLAQCLRGNVFLAHECARALIRYGEAGAAPVLHAVQASETARKVLGSAANRYRPS